MYSYRYNDVSLTSAFLWYLKANFKEILRQVQTGMTCRGDDKVFNFTSMMTGDFHLILQP